MVRNGFAYVNVNVHKMPCTTPKAHCYNPLSYYSSTTTELIMFDIFTVKWPNTTNATMEIVILTLCILEHFKLQFHSNVFITACDDNVNFWW